MPPHCHGELTQAEWKTEWKVLWPGASVELVDPQALEDATNQRFMNGDRFRFIVFTRFDRPDDSWLQVRVVSREQVVSAPSHQ
jgi:hypothetical protein